MGNIENLRPVKKGQRTKEEQKEFATKGGIASGEARRKSKQMRIVLEYLMEKEIDKKGGGKATTLEAICTSMVKEAMAGSVKATTFIRDTIGQMPETKHVLKGDNGLSITVEDEKHKKMLEDL